MVGVIYTRMCIDLKTRTVDREELRYRFWTECMERERERAE